MNLRSANKTRVGGHNLLFEAAAGVRVRKVLGRAQRRNLFEFCFGLKYI